MEREAIISGLWLPRVEVPEDREIEKAGNGMSILGQSTSLSV